MNDYQFFYAHFRIDATTNELKRYHRGQTDWTPAARGGSTVCRVTDADSNPVSSGRALCSLQDAFCYRLGRTIAKGRAMKGLHHAPAIHRVERIFLARLKEMST